MNSLETSMPQFQAARYPIGHSGWDGWYQKDTTKQFLHSEREQNIR